MYNIYVPIRNDILTFLTSSSADSNRDKDKSFTTCLTFYFIDWILISQYYVIIIYLLY